MWLMTITVGLVTLILVKWLKDYVQRWRMPPGPFFWPIIGNLSLFSGKSYLTFIDLAKTYGDVFSLKMGMTDVVVLNSLDAVKEAFVKRGEDFAGRPKMLTTDISSEGGKDIAFSDYSPTWKLHRKLFHSAIRGYASGQNLQSKVHESLEDTVAVFSKMEGQAVDLEDYIYQLVYNVICSAAFGIRYNMDDEDFNTLMKISKDMTETFGQGLLADVYPLLRFLPSSSVTFYRKMTYQLMEIMQRHLEQHRESFDPNNLRDITDHMIKAQKDAEEEGIRDIDSLTDTHLRQLIGDIFFVVTGSTDGIGKAYAEQLAAHGLNIVLISRSEDKLKAVAAKIEGRTAVRTKTVVADFCSSKIYGNIKQELEGLDIACLVNNVGMKAASHPEFFLQVEEEVTETMIYCNVISMIKMTKIVLPGMVERKKGVIINLSSIFSTAPVPLMALYSGTKAFGSLFSESLAAEYKDKGIIIQTVTPSFVSTKMIGNLATNFFVATPKSFVRCALSTVGLASNTCGYFSHSLQLWLAGLFPRDVFCNWVTMPVMKKLRQLGMEELQSKKKK